MWCIFVLDTTGSSSAHVFIVDFVCGYKLTIASSSAATLNVWYMTFFLLIALTERFSDAA